MHVQPTANCPTCHGSGRLNAWRDGKRVHCPYCDNGRVPADLSGNPLGTREANPA